MGTVKFWSKWTIKATRLIGGGTVDEVKEKAEKFLHDVQGVAPNADAPTLEANSAGLCVSLFVRCADMDDVNKTIEAFRQHGWKEGR